MCFGIVSVAAVAVAVVGAWVCTPTAVSVLQLDHARSLSIATDAAMHHEDALVSVVFSRATGQTCFAPLQVGRKACLWDVTDCALRQLAHAKKLQRMSSYSFLKSLGNILQGLGLSLDQFRMPAGILVWCPTVQCMLPLACCSLLLIAMCFE